MLRRRAEWKVAQTNLGKDPNCKPEASDFLGTLLRDETSSHLLETLVAKSSPSIFTLLWSTYFQQQLPRLSVHPVANFVVARALARIDEVQLGGVCEELGKSWQKIISGYAKSIVCLEVDGCTRRILKSRRRESVSRQGSNPKFTRRRSSRGPPLCDSSSTVL